MGLSQSTQRKASIALGHGTGTSPTHSAASSILDHSPGFSPDSQPTSPPLSPTTLALPDSASTYLLAEKHLDSGSSSDDDSLENGLGPKNLSAELSTEDSLPKLTCCGLIRANVAAAYAKFADSKVGLVTRAFVMSLPQSLALSASLGFAFSGLITPIVIHKEDNSHIQNYFLFAVIASLNIFTFTTFYDTFHRLKSHFSHEDYNSFGIFHLRATFMGAALGDSALRTIMYDLAQSKNVWLNFSLTLPATLIPAYVRYITFKHDIVPSKLSGKDKNSSPVKLDEKKKNFLKGRFFNVVMAPFVSAASWLLLYRAIQTNMLATDAKPFTTVKTLSAIIPSILGLAAKLCEQSHPHSAYRWKQLDVLVGDAAMIFISLSGCLPNPSNESEAPDYWWGPMAATAFVCSLILGTIQASRVKAPESTEKNLPDTLVNKKMSFSAS